MVDFEKKESENVVNIYQELLVEKCKETFFKIYIGGSLEKRAFDEKGNKISYYAWQSKIKRSDFFVTEKVSDILDEMTLTEIKAFFAEQLRDFYEQATMD